MSLCRRGALTRVCGIVLCVRAAWVWFTNQERLLAREKAATMIQVNWVKMMARWRAHLYWSWYVKTILGARRVQAWFRGVRVAWRYHVTRAKIVLISPWWRCWHQYWVYVNMKAAATQIEKIARGVLVRVWYRRLRHAATVLSNTWRLAKSWRFVEVR